MKYLYANSVKRTKNFRYVDWSFLIDAIANPPSYPVTTPDQAKKLSAIVGATDAPTKQKEEVLKHNHFTLLRLDLDDTDFDLASISETLQAMGLGSFVIHTTATHQYENNGNRYRVYIELAEPLDLETWQTIETYLSFVFRADDCANRPQQIMYLPCLFCGGEYQYHINQGDAYLAQHSQLLADSMAFKLDQEAEVERVQRAKAQLVTQRRPEKLVGKQVSLIDAINQSYNWETLLAHYGYKKQGKAWLAPESSSKTAGVYLLVGHDGKERYYSHHENDPCATGRCIDLFDFLVIRVFQGDSKAAIKHMAGTTFKHIDQHNKQEYMRHKFMKDLKRDWA